MPVRFGAWKFVLDGELQPGLHVTVGRADTVQGEDSIHQALLLLLSTRPGERVMRPQYGCDLDRFVFSPIDDTTAGIAIHYVTRAIERWEPRIELLAIDARRSPNPQRPEQLDLLIEYRVRATGRDGQVAVSIGGPV